MVHARQDRGGNRGRRRCPDARDGGDMADMRKRGRGCPNRFKIMRRDAGRACRQPTGGGLQRN